MASNFKQQLEQTFQQRGVAFARDLEANLKDVLQQNGIVATGELLNSIKTAVSTENVRLIFMQYGTFRDMRKLEYGSQPPAEIIKEWVLAKGVDSFYVPGYPSGSGGLNRDAAASRIAFGIARGIFQKGVVRRTRSERWYRSQMRKELNKFEQLLGQELAQVVALNIKESFE